MPYAEDVRAYNFPSLDSLVSKNGTKIREHPNLPTKDMNKAMEAFVDANNLMDADTEGEDGSVDPLVL